MAHVQEDSADSLAACSRSTAIILEAPMPFYRGNSFRTLSLLLGLSAIGAFGPIATMAQGGSAGSIHGTVTDPSGAVIPGATVHLTNQGSGLDRTVTTDALGQFEIPNVSFNPYR